MAINRLNYFFLYTLCLLLSALSSSLLYSQPAQQHAILVIIDGARYSETLGDPTGQYIPRMKQLATQSAVVDTFLNDSVTVTKRAIPAIWSGSWKTPRDTTIGGVATQYTLDPTVWEYFRKHRNQDSTNAMYILKQLSGPWLPSYHPQYGPQYWPWYIMQDGYWSDLFVWNLAKQKLNAHHPIFSVIYFADVDAAGHSGDWNNYTRKITIADSIVGMIWDYVQSDSIFKNQTTLFVTNDHGRHLDGVSTGFVSHGDGCWGCRRIQLLAIGSGAKKGVSSTKRRIPDIVPTIGALLNFTSPFSTGTAMTEILKPIISIDKKSINFGTLPFSSSKTDSIIVYNSGGSSLNITTSTPSSFSINPTSTSILPHTNRKFYITFSPTNSDSISSFIIINHNDEHLRDTIRVSGKGTQRIPVAVNKGWNLISLPLSVDNGRINSLFTNTTSFAFSYDGQYIQTDSLKKGIGYWLKFDSTMNFNITGIEFLTGTIDVAAGWNLIGSVSQPILVSSIQTIPGEIISSSFYGYDNSYIDVNTILPGKGYWIKVNATGKLILKGN
ncbi:MAG: hypothetical protein QME58_06505 [Bacteroidota bacterium]|nr:hypothetical protein [Bacteroidota bacterium]